MAHSDDEPLRLELNDLFASARSGQLERADFVARLQSLHAHFLGEEASGPKMMEQRRNAAKAYDHFLSGTDRHHDLERLAQALGVDAP